MYVGFLGKLFLCLLKMLLIPLLIASLISGIGAINIQIFRSIGFKAIIYFFSTSLSAAILGIVLVIIISPGTSIADFSESKSNHYSIRETTTQDILLDLVRNLFPENLIQACLNHYQTKLIPPKIDGENVNMEGKHSVQWDFKGIYTGSTNIVGLVFFSLFTGLILSMTGQRSLPMLNFFTAVNIVIMKMVGMIIWLSPIGIFFLISSEIIKMKSFGILVGALGMYMATVILGLLIHSILVLPVLFFAFTRRNPFKFMYKISEALITAFATVSSSTTLPITLKCMEENNQIDPRVTRFILPVGAAVNMDGTVLYQAVAVLFIAQFREINITFGKIIALGLIATVASIGTGGIPQGGLITMIMGLDVVGLPTSDISLIISIDWFLNRFRTVVNVLGDSIGAGIIYHTSKDLLLKPVDKHGQIAAEVG